MHIAGIFVALVSSQCTCAILSSMAIQHAIRMSHIVFNGLSSSTVFFPHYFINGKPLQKKVTEHKMCFDFVYEIYLRYFLFQEELSDILSKLYIGLHGKYSLILSDCNETLIFSTDFREILKFQIS